MMFISKNEDGIPAWLLVMQGKKTVTRRTKPLVVGKEFAIQSGRGKPSIGRARVKSCVPHTEWMLETSQLPNYREVEQGEGKLEGFNGWLGLISWFGNRELLMTDTYRIEFEVIFHAQVCGVCGCSQYKACMGGCSWTDLPNVCSQCRENIPIDGAGQIQDATRAERAGRGTHAVTGISGEDTPAMSDEGPLSKQQGRGGQEAPSSNSQEASA